MAFKVTLLLLLHTCYTTVQVQYPEVLRLKAYAETYLH